MGRRVRPCRPVRPRAYGALSFAALFWLLLAVRPPRCFSSPLVTPFPLSSVRLDPSSELQAAYALNEQYLLMLEPDNLLYNFRTTANLSAPGRSYGGWEWSTVEVRGQFIGHYMSATALAYNYSGSAAVKAKGDAVVAGLLEVQAAWTRAGEPGYVAAFPPSHFDRLEALQPVWVPYYVVHKILAGFVDQYELVGKEDALAAALAGATYFCGRVERVVADRGIDHWLNVLDVEFGGMNDVLYRLSGILLERDDLPDLDGKKHADALVGAARRADESDATPSARADESAAGLSERLAACAARFDKPAFFDPLSRGEDPLNGLHANTHLAQAVGFARRADERDDPTATFATLSFFNALTRRHSFSTGGSNWYEHWYAPDVQGDALANPDAGALTQESCTTYNVLKVARSIFQWTADPSVADFYERALLNGVLGIQRKPPAPADGSDAKAVYDAAKRVEAAKEGRQEIVQRKRQEAAKGERIEATQNVRQEAANMGRGLTQDAAGLGAVEVRRDPERLPGATAPIASASSAQGSLLPLAPRTLGPRVLPTPLLSSAYSRSSRPADHRVASWPSDPGAALRAAVDGAGPPGPGVYLYLYPLGLPNWKGDTTHSWSHGWGDPFNTFWCCYGSAVESFSKLADSIFFKSTSKEGYPVLYITQPLADAELRWDEAGIKATLSHRHVWVSGREHVRINITLRSIAPRGPDAYETENGPKRSSSYAQDGNTGRDDDERPSGMFSGVGGSDASAKTASWRGEGQSLDATKAWESQAVGLAVARAIDERGGAAKDAVVEGIKHSRGDDAVYASNQAAAGSRRRSGTDNLESLMRRIVTEGTRPDDEDHGSLKRPASSLGARQAGMATEGLAAKARSAQRAGAAHDAEINDAILSLLEEDAPESLRRTKGPVRGGKGGRGDAGTARKGAHNARNAKSSRRPPEDPFEPLFGTNERYAPDDDISGLLLLAIRVPSWADVGLRGVRPKTVIVNGVGNKVRKTPMVPEYPDDPLSRFGAHGLGAAMTGGVGWDDRLGRTAGVGEREAAAHAGAFRARVAAERLGRRPGAHPTEAAARKRDHAEGSRAKDRPRDPFRGASLDVDAIRATMQRTAKKPTLSGRTSTSTSAPASASSMRDGRPSASFSRDAPFVSSLAAMLAGSFPSASSSGGEFSEGLLRGAGSRRRAAREGAQSERSGPDAPSEDAIPIPSVTSPIAAPDLSELPTSARRAARLATAEAWALRSASSGPRSRFLIVGPEWHEGDSVLINLPVSTTVEAIEDSRPVMRRLGAILRGPRVMAALTAGGTSRSLSLTQAQTPSRVVPIPKELRGTSVAGIEGNPNAWPKDDRPSYADGLSTSSSGADGSADAASAASTDAVASRSSIESLSKGTSAPVEKTAATTATLPSAQTASNTHYPAWAASASPEEASAEASDEKRTTIAQSPNHVVDQLVLHAGELLNALYGKVEERADSSPGRGASSGARGLLASDKVSIESSTAANVTRNSSRDGGKGRVGDASMQELERIRALLVDGLLGGNGDDSRTDLVSTPFGSENRTLPSDGEDTVGVDAPDGQTTAGASDRSDSSRHADSNATSNAEAAGRLKTSFDALLAGSLAFAAEAKEVGHSINRWDERPAEIPEASRVALEAAENAISQARDVIADSNGEQVSKQSKKSSTGSSKWMPRSRHPLFPALDEIWPRLPIGSSMWLSIADANDPSRVLRVGGGGGALDSPRNMADWLTHEDVRRVRDGATFSSSVGSAPPPPKIRASLACGKGGGLDATFRVHHLRPLYVAVESVSAPGHYLIPDPATGQLALVPKRFPSLAAVLTLPSEDLSAGWDVSLGPRGRTFSRPNATSPTFSFIARGIPTDLFGRTAEEIQVEMAKEGERGNGVNAAGSSPGATGDGTPLARGDGTARVTRARVSEPRRARPLTAEEVRLRVDRELHAEAASEAVSHYQQELLELRRQLGAEVARIRAVSVQGPEEKRQEALKQATGAREHIGHVAVRLATLATQPGFHSKSRSSLANGSKSQQQPRAPNDLAAPRRVDLGSAGSNASTTERAFSSAPGKLPSALARGETRGLEAGSDSEDPSAGGKVLRGLERLFWGKSGNSGGPTWGARATRPTAPAARDVANGTNSTEAEGSAAPSNGSAPNAGVDAAATEAILKAAKEARAAIVADPDSLEQIDPETRLQLEAVIVELERRRSRTVVGADMRFAWVDASRGPGGSVSGSRLFEGDPIPESGPGTVESFRFVPPVTKDYPDGSMLLKDEGRDWILSPLSSIVDEHYAAHLEFLPESAEVLEAEA